MSSRIEIKCVSYDEIPGILEIYSSFVKDTPVTFEIEIPNVEEMWDRVSGILKKLPFLVCLVDSKVAGYAYASNFRSRQAYQWSKEVSVYVHPDFRRGKIAKTLYTALIEILKYQGIVNLLAVITLPNFESVSFHEKMGFQKAGELISIGFKLGKWHTVGWWKMGLNSDNLPPVKSLTPFNEIENSDFVKEVLLKAQMQIIL
ncbi:MAG: N-acetyltransferase [Prolixibacteraceae bacterium]|nr:N-acetyltransferase [Prolixibacteraceae bacterium]